MKIRMRLLREGQQGDNLAAFTAFLDKAGAEQANAPGHEDISGESSDAAASEYFEYDSFYRRIGVL